MAGAETGGGVSIAGSRAGVRDARVAGDDLAGFTPARRLIAFLIATAALTTTSRALTLDWDGRIFAGETGMDQKAGGKEQDPRRS